MTKKPDTEAAKQRRIYGRGLYTGLRLAGIEDPEEFMNAARLKEAEKGQRMNARKVLAQIPTSHRVDSSYVDKRLREQGVQMDRRVLQGCLSSLCGAGLVVERPGGSFVRVVAKEKSPIPQPPQENKKPELKLVSKEPKAAEPTTKTDDGDNDVLDRFTACADEAKAVAEHAMKLASNIENLALDIASKLDTIRADTAKLEQLRAMLRSL